MSSILRSFLLSAMIIFATGSPSVANDNHDLAQAGQSKYYPFESIIVGANIDLFAGSRDFGPENAKRELKLREVEVSLEARINPWLYGMIFLTKPSGEPFEVEEALVIADLNYGIRLKAF